MSECKHENDITLMRDDITEIKGDIKDILRFKWQIFGGFATVVFFVTTTISVLAIFKK